jgi:hypothetical protein
LGLRWWHGRLLTYLQHSQPRQQSASGSQLPESRVVAASAVMVLRWTVLPLQGCGMARLLARFVVLMCATARQRA